MVDSWTTYPPAPIETEPIDYYRSRDIAEIKVLIDEALEGMDGDYDRRIIKWAKSMWDQPTMVTIASLILRARREQPR